MRDFYSGFGMSQSEGTSVQHELQQALSSVREELDDHRESINENTDEVQSNYHLLQQLNAKIDKLAERIDLMQTMLTSTTIEPRKTFAISPLTQKEKEVFQSLYSLAHEKESITYEELARRCCITTALAVSYVTNLIEKGVPVWKKYIGKTVHLTLDPEFVLDQAKNNTVGVTIPLTHWF